MTTTISPTAAARLLREDPGALLIDVREPDEHARAHIPGARNLPLSRLEAADLALPPGRTLIFHCRSGARTAAQAGRLAALAGPGREALAVEGGLDAWRRAGLPVVEDRRQPIELMRQVQIAAGSLVLAGVLGGALVAPAFYVLAGFVGAGLVFAGTTGFCGMARLLQAMPWNRAAAAATRPA